MKNVILLGFRGVGKTYIGSKFGDDFIDTDHEIIKEYGGSISEIHKRVGEKRFRELERDVLHRCQDALGKVIATGGGIVTTLENCELIRKLGITIYLKASKKRLREHFVSLPPHFVDAKDPTLSFERLLKERKPIYEKLSDYTLDTTDLNIIEKIEGIRHGKQ